MSEEMENKEQEVKPVKVGRGATIFLVVGACIVLFILVLTIRGCSISKNVNSGSYEQSYETLPTQPLLYPTEGPRETTKPVQNSPENECSVPTPEENSTSGNESTPTIKEPNGFSEVAEPVLSSVKTSYGMVVGKHIYTKGGSYIYGVNISVVIGDESVSVEYFCPRKTYDGLNSGDSLNVAYQVDSNGNISVYSISK